jgi:hypothetical protein
MGEIEVGHIETQKRSLFFSKIIKNKLPKKDIPIQEYTKLP